MDKVEYANNIIVPFASKVCARNAAMAVKSIFFLTLPLFAFLMLARDAKNGVPREIPTSFFSTTTNRSILKHKSTDGEHCFLVTGVAGYIGSHMALSLLEKGECVLGIESPQHLGPAKVQMK